MDIEEIKNTLEQRGDLAGLKEILANLSHRDLYNQACPKVRRLRTLLKMRIKLLGQPSYIVRQAMNKQR